MKTCIQEVLAKSKPPISLKQHTDECLYVFKSLEKAFERLPITDVEHFWELIRLSLIFHDLGKIHPEFQKMLLGKRANWYHQRHELFSVPFIDKSSLDEDDKFFLELVVAGHHKDFKSLFDFIQCCYNSGSDLFSFPEDGKLEWKEELGKLNLEFVRSFLNDYEIQFETKALTNSILNIKKYLGSPVNTGNSKFLKLLLLAGALKQCDHSASAGIFKVNVLEDRHFKFLYDNPWIPYNHQKEASNTLGNMILTAPTGSGKTEASLMWLNKQLKETGQGRAFYILPFTASINAMYERLDEKMEGNSEIVGLVHGKLSEYIESRFEEQDYSSENENFKKELKENYRALVPPLKVVTPFQLLKSIFGLKGFEKGLFEMGGGYFIFDEIHAYDSEVTAQILVLIEFATQLLNVNVCLMTATLPSFLKREFVKAIGDFNEVTADEALYRSFVRHKVRVEEGLLSEHIPDIQKRLNNGDKVLVVCNTVKQAQLIYNTLVTACKVLLHSAFNGVDRNEKESKLKLDEVKLLVGTQAIEVSLDIDYDVIFTEPAPLDALLQRFGRVNRHRINGEYRPPCDCIVFSHRNDVDKYIYKNEEIINRTLEVLRKIEFCNKGVILEADLQKYIDQVYPCWSDKDKEDFDRVYTSLKVDVRENLAPFIYDLHREEEFEKQFDGVKVLPSILENEYNKFIEENKFIKAESLKISISKRRFISLSINRDIYRTIFAFEAKGKEVIKEQAYYVINRKYDNELGLQLDEEEKSNEQNCLL